MRPIRNAPGFTIVELLIVIVVIAILAAITIVAFNGMQTRAENTKTLSGIDQFSKALQLYKTQNGGYPLTSSSTMAYGCVGEVGESCGMVSGTAGPDCAGIGYATGVAALNNAIKTVIANIPTVSSQSLQCQSKTVKGAVYFVWGGGNKDAYLIYYLKGDQPCASPGASTVDVRTYFADGGTTRCSLKFTG